MLGVVTHWSLVSQQPDGQVVELQPTMTSAVPPASTETSFETSMPGTASLEVSLLGASTFTTPLSVVGLSLAISTNVTSADFASTEISVKESARAASMVSRLGLSIGESARVSWVLRASAGTEVSPSGLRPSTTLR
jgi:hypothetical protein